MVKVVLASKNEYKKKEMTEIIRKYYPQVEIEGVEGEEVDEIASTLRGNALAKVEACIKEIPKGEREGVLVIGDDSGLFVDHLSGAPGVYSARYAEKELGYRGKNREDVEGRSNQLILERLKGVRNRRAEYRTALAYVLLGEAEPEVHILEVGQEVYVGKEERVTEEGFAYDYICKYPSGENKGKYISEVSVKYKEQVSSRHKGLERLLMKLKVRESETKKGEEQDGQEGQDERERVEKVY